MSDRFSEDFLSPLEHEAKQVGSDFHCLSRMLNRAEGEMLGHESHLRNLFVCLLSGMPGISSDTRPHAGQE
jgi:hypothetical protein